MKADILPVVTSSDINAYSMARAFHEAYGVKSLMIARKISGTIDYSKILDFRCEPNLTDDKVFMNTLRGIYEEFKDQYKHIIILGCTDHYVRLIVAHKKELSKMFVVPYADQKVLDNLILKENFYKLCDKNKVDYPATKIFKNGDDPKKASVDFPYPIILKPSDSADYFAHEFEGQYKVYTIENQTELRKVLKQIYDAGYTGNMIMQDRIPGADSAMYDLHCFVGRDHKVQYMNLGNVLLEEHTPMGLGSNAATITVYNEPLMLQIRDLLESIGMEGWCDADLKYDERDGKIKIFEINIRQGRSHYRNTGAGYNVAKYIVDAYVYNKKKKLLLVNEPYFWHVIPKSLVLKYISDDKKAQVKKLIHEKKVCTSLFYPGDKSWRRNLYLRLRDINMVRKYKKYY